MKKYKLIGVIAISAAMIFSTSVLASPAGNSTLSEMQGKLVQLAEKSWVCSKCGFHIVTKSGNQPSGGSCTKGGSHDWEEGE